MCLLKNCFHASTKKLLRETRKSFLKSFFIYFCGFLLVEEALNFQQKFMKILISQKANERKTQKANEKLKKLMKSSKS
jgi:hypothetical protein